jgi:hypothetical protein
MVPTGGAGFVTFLPHDKVIGQLTLAIGLLGLQQDMPFDNTSQYALTWDNSTTPRVCARTVITNTATTFGHFQLRLSQDGQQIDMIHTDAGLIVSLTGYQADSSRCAF